MTEASRALARDALCKEQWHCLRLTDSNRS
jgi:hypothetical protein